MSKIPTLDQIKEQQYVVNELARIQCWSNTSTNADLEYMQKAKEELPHEMTILAIMIAEYEANYESSLSELLRKNYRYHKVEIVPEAPKSFCQRLKEFFK